MPFPIRLWILALGRTLWFWFSLLRTFGLPFLTVPIGGAFFFFQGPLQGGKDVLCFGSFCSLLFSHLNLYSEPFLKCSFFLFPPSWGEVFSFPPFFFFFVLSLSKRGAKVFDALFCFFFPFSQVPPWIK